MPRQPLVTHRCLAEIVAYRKGLPISVGHFLADVYRIAGDFPASPFVLNACADRYRFAVGFAAALFAGKVSLLPANLTSATVSGLKERYNDLFCLTDSDHVDLAVPRVRFRDATAGSAPATGTIPEIDIDRPVAWLFTSGSTGEPVAHLKTWGALVRNVRIEAERLGLRCRRGDVIVATVPPQHSYGLESSVLVAMQGGVAFSAARPFYPIDICAALAEVPRPRILVSTPFHLRLLLDSGATIPALDLVVSATAPIAPSLVSAIEDRCGVSLVEIYGSTDTGQIASRRPSATSEWRLFDGITLVPEDDRTWALGGHVGAPVILHDVVEVTGEDRFLLLGRSTDLVNIAGKRSSLDYLTHQLSTLPGVLDGAYFMPEEGTADAAGITRLAAAAVVAPGVTARQLQQALRLRIDPIFLPRPLLLVDALPRNATGKLTREALQGLVTQRGRRLSEQG